MDSHSSLGRPQAEPLKVCAILLRSSYLHTMMRPRNHECLCSHTLIPERQQVAVYKRTQLPQKMIPSRGTAGCEAPLSKIKIKRAREREREKERR